MKPSTRNRTKGAARQAKGKMKHALGHATRSARLRHEGRVEEKTGRAQRNIGKAQKEIEEGVKGDWG